MEYFLEMRFLLRSLMTLKQKQTSMMNWYWKKETTGIWTSIQVGNASHIPGHCQKPCELANSDCWNHLLVFLSCSYLYFSSICSVTTNTPKKLCFFCQHFVILDKFWRNHFKLNLINSMGLKGTYFWQIKPYIKRKYWIGKVFPKKHIISQDLCHCKSILIIHRK